MKKLFILLLALVMVFTLPACKSETTVTENANSLEDYFPADWADRYVITEVENVSADVFCKSAYGNNTDNGWLFRISLMDAIPDNLPAATGLGTYDGKAVVATYPTEAYEFESDDIAADYRNMASDVEEILHQLLHVLGGEHDHEHPISTEHNHDHPIITEPEVPNPSSSGNYETPDTLGIEHSFVGVYHLDVSYWSEESKNELLDPNNQNGFLSIAPDGTAYLKCGNDVTEGTAMIYSDPNNVPDDKYMYELTFNGKTYYANMYQQILTIDDMPEYSNPDGLKGTSWTFMHETDDWWTEETFRDDIG